jgi:deoxyxylulose-5-phosphate synthase
MALEDLATMRAVWGSTVLYPCDANQTARLVARMVDLRGVSFLRTTRGATPVIYDPSEEFEVGGSRVLRSTGADGVTIVAAGVTVHEALRAAERLEPLVRLEIDPASRRDHRREALTMLLQHAGIDHEVGRSIGGELSELPGEVVRKVDSTLPHTRCDLDRAERQAGIRHA